MTGRGKGEKGVKWKRMKYCSQQKNKLGLSSTAHSLESYVEPTPSPVFFLFSALSHCWNFAEEINQTLLMISNRKISSDKHKNMK